MHGDRVLVVGTTGSGKSRLAAALARRLAVPHIELDALYHGPGWTPLPDDELVRRVANALDASPGWVVDGNYRVVRELVLSRATDVVWLDYPHRVVLWRVARRSLARVLLRRELWNGNRETWRDWRDPEHPLRWAWTSHPVRRADYEALSADDGRWHRLRRPRAVRGLTR